jgi:lysophospholipase L1-like esterase
MRTPCGFFKATARIDFEVRLDHSSHPGGAVKMRGSYSIVLGLLFSCSVAQSQQATTPGTTFALKDGDHVVFYGDSITEQRLYTSDIEEFMLTRFPGSRVIFTQAGVGGDRVSGGRAGPIDQRLERDVFAYHPTVVTIMLGMNDGYTRPYDPGIFESYADGYRHIVDAIQSKLPEARLTVLKPSPYDDVNRDPQFENGYNAVLQHYGEFISQLAIEKHLQVADLNTPVVAALTKAKALDPALATNLIPDRVHPGAGVHWLMAEAVLKAWGALPLVTSVTIDAGKPAVLEALDSQITELRKSKGSVTWLEADQALPLPLPSKDSDPFLDLAARASDLMEALDQEMLRIRGLAPGKYELKIDERSVGIFDDNQLSSSINLALLETPMLEQARLVAFDTERRNEIERARFSLIQQEMSATLRAAASELAAFQERAVEQQRKDARPFPHRYSLSLTP